MEIRDFIVKLLYYFRFDVVSSMCVFLVLFRILSYMIKKMKRNYFDLGDLDDIEDEEDQKSFNSYYDI